MNLFYALIGAMFPVRLRINRATSDTEMAVPAQCRNLSLTSHSTVA